MHKKSKVREPKRSQADNAGGPTYSTRTEWSALHRIPGRGRDRYSAQGTPYHGPARDEDARAPRADEGTYTRETLSYRETSIENALRLTRGLRKHRT